MSLQPRIYISLDRHWLYRLGFDWWTYRRLIRRAGGIPKTIFYQLESGGDQAMQLDLESFDGLLLGGGVDVDPNHYRAGIESSSASKRIKRERDEFELRLIRHSMSVGRPIMGICRGCQLLNVALGGSLRILGRNRLHRHVARCWKHPVSIRRDSLLYQILATKRLPEVRSLHSEAVDRLGEGARVVAKSPDGVVEAIEAVGDQIQSSFCLGVQWHPELIAWGNADQPLIDAFIRAATKFHQSRASSFASPDIQ